MKRTMHQSPARRLSYERDALRAQVARLSADLQFIAEDRESELEERAQEEWAGRLMLRLQERSRREIEEIDAALQRMADGSYGVCSGCGRQILWARLRALPGTRCCVGCAREEEAQSTSHGDEREIRAGRRITPDDDFRRDEFLLSRTRVSESVVLDELRS